MMMILDTFVPGFEHEPHGSRLGPHVLLDDVTADFQLGGGHFPCLMPRLFAKRLRWR